MRRGQPVQLCACSLPPGCTQVLPRSEDTWCESPAALNDRLFHLPHFWGGKNYTRDKENILLSSHVFLLFMLYHCTFFFTSGKVCECVCVCCINRDSEKDASLLWLEQQNAVIFNYIKSICLKVNRKTLSTKKKKKKTSEFSRYCFSSLSHRFIILKFLKIFPREFPQTTSTSFTLKKKRIYGTSLVISGKTLHVHCRGRGFAPWLQSSDPTYHLVWPINKWGVNTTVSVTRTLPGLCDPPGTWSRLSSPCGLTSVVPTA